MSKVKTFRVDTKGKKGVRRPHAPDLIHNQELTFNVAVAENTPWIKALVEKGNLVDVTSGEKKAPVKSEEPKKTYKKESKKPSKKEEVETVAEEVVEPSVEVEAPVEAPKEESGEETSSLEDNKD